MMRRLRFTLVLLAVGACYTPPPVTSSRDAEPARARAALATLHIDNRSAERLTVLYRIASRGAAEVVVGQVPARSFLEVAPVPAGEPLVLVARTAAGAELTLDSRAFQIDAEWTWVIAVDAPFQRAQADGPER
jgi:hypothetical protein